MPTPTTSIDHMIYTLSENAFYYHYHPAQGPSTSTGGKSKGGLLRDITKLKHWQLSDCLCI